MARLYSDLLSGSARRYYFGLNSAPGGVSPAPAVLTLSGRGVEIFQNVTVFRNPATAVLTLNGTQVSTDVILRPAQAALSALGQIPGELRQLVITPAIPTPDYADLQSTAPTILFINTISPTTGLIRLQSLELNATPGGNIAYITPITGLLTLQSTGNVTLIFIDIGVGLATLIGHAPTLLTQLVVQPEVASITVNGQQVGVQAPFTWIDVDAPPPLTWTTTTGVAA
jgi:hypothetical protein